MLINKESNNLDMQGPKSTTLELRIETWQGTNMKTLNLMAC